MSRALARARGAVLSVYAGFGIIGAVYYPFYAVAMVSRGLSATGLGLLAAASALIGALISPAWGHLADRVFGRRLALAIGESSSAVGILLFAFGDLGAAIAGTLLMAIAGSASSGSADALALGIARDGGPRYAVTRAVTSFTYASTALASGIAIRDGGTSAIAPLLALGLCCTILPIPLLREPGEERRRRVRTKTSGGLLSRLGTIGEALHLSPALGPFIAVVFCAEFAAIAFTRFGALRISAAGGDAAMLGLGGAIAAYVEVPFMLNARRLTDRIGLRRGFAASTALFGVLTFAVALLTDPFALTLLRLFEGATFATTLMCAIEIVDRLLPRRLHATGQALFHSAGALGGALGGIAAGLVYDAAGPTVLFAGGGAMLGVIALIALRALPRGSELRRAAAEHAEE